METKELPALGLEFLIIIKQIIMGRKKIDHPYTDYDQWFDEYKPVINHFHNDDSQAFNGCLYETYGEEDDYIRKLAETEPNKVWTILTDDHGDLVVVNGWHYVNRFGYFVTEKPWVDGADFNIYDIDDIKKILRREARERTKLKKQKQVA